MPQTPPRSVRLALRWLNSPLLRLAGSMNRRFAAASASATMCSDLVAIARHALADHCAVEDIQRANTMQDF